jgi:hypothetical protein
LITSLLCVGATLTVQEVVKPLPPINNDYVLSADGTTMYVSANDGHLYAVSFATGEPRRSPPTLCAAA